MPTIDINPDFRRAFHLIEEEGKNLFLTGKAGTGKSTFLRYFRENTKKKVVVLAPTGVAALNVEWATIHSFFRFPPHITEEEVVKKARTVEKDDIYHHIDLIIIDEISMVRADLLDFVDIFLRNVKKSDVPFWWIQMLMIGDLYQLPPVVSGEEKQYFREAYLSPFFFSSHVITEGGFDMELIELDHIYRQSDEHFISLLNAIRNRSITDAEIEMLNTRIDATFEDPDFITLTPTNDLADTINGRELEKLRGRSTIFQAKVQGDFGERNYPTDVSLALKKWARVMFLYNDTNGRWVNGSIGTVEFIEEDAVMVAIDGEKSPVRVEPHTWEVKRYAYDRMTRSLSTESVGSFTQIPLRLSWAVTIHKSQGKTFDRVILDIGRGMFAHGQAYVALSRCRTLEGMVLKKPLKPAHVILDYAVITFLTKYQYARSEASSSLEDKIAILEKSMQEATPIEIVYLKSNDTKSKRSIRVQSIREEVYMGKSFLAVRWFCLMRQEERVFRVDRILEIR